MRTPDNRKIPNFVWILLILKFSINLREHNAALSGEQRRPPYLNHCAVNTEAESNRKCRAL
ncbi:hypothetical protein D5E84_23455 [Vibrio parahaemolyticus]|nr:hypothetical protein D5E84_23455 [Vibrio parahaemolyticus]